ncbi:putative motility protein [Brevibacillus sp. Leaf182]|uniref:putative motility protein n=1 Tax=Brevibacillus sp. Leaf182 TaxID=1736290 RepID=UPI0009EBEDB3|nr:putative motility protein [Brevibacillus sp. Leaf182]RAT98700.1 putative motility protein [Brevibacillus sp. Leaf182]
MSPIQLQQAVNISLTKQVQETAQAQAATMLEGFAKTQQNIQAAQAAHPSLGKVLDVKV